MSAYPILPLFTDAFIADTGHLSAQETGAYLMLMMVAWRSPECSLPDDDDRLARWARVDRRTWLRIKPAIMEFWTLENGVWTQKRLSKERVSVSNRAAVARENGKHGGRPKSLPDNDMANPAGSARDSKRKPPISTSKDHSEDKPLHDPPKVACRVPDDFEHWPEAHQIAAEFGYVGDQVADVLGEFVDYWRPLPAGKAAMKTDWPATLRNRLRELRRRQPKPRSPARASPPEKSSPLTRLADRMEARYAEHRSVNPDTGRRAVIDHEGDGRPDREIRDADGGEAGRFSTQAALRLVGAYGR